MNDNKTLAMKSLTNWRNLSTTASNEELVKSLTKIKRLDIATHVQTELQAMR